MEFQKAFLVDKKSTAGYPDGPVEIFGVVFISQQQRFNHAAQIEPQLCYHVVFENGQEQFIPVADVAKNGRYRILCENDVLNGLRR